MMNTKEQMRAFEEWARTKPELFVESLGDFATDEDGEYTAFCTRLAYVAWQAALNSLEGKSVPEDLENEITIDRRDLFDFLWARIKSVLDDYSNESEAANWSTATDLTSKVFDDLHIAAPQPPEDRVRELETELARAQYRLEHMLPLFEEARDALTAIPLASAKLHSVSLTLADRMDEIGTMSQQAVDSAIAAIKEPNKLEGEG